MPPSESLFSNVQYALFAAPAAVVVGWVAWRVMAWCRFRTASLLGRIFPGLAPTSRAAPRVFARSTSRVLSQVFLFCLALPLAIFPLKILAYRLAGPQISLWHWLLVFGPILVLATWLVARLRPRQDRTIAA